MEIQLSLFQMFPKRERKYRSKIKWYWKYPYQTRMTIRKMKNKKAYFMSDVWTGWVDLTLTMYRKYGNKNRRIAHTQKMGS